MGYQVKYFFIAVLALNPSPASRQVSWRESYGEMSRMPTGMVYLVPTATGTVELWDMGFMTAVSRRDGPENGVGIMQQSAGLVHLNILPSGSRQ